MYDIEEELVRLAGENSHMVRFTAPANRAFYPPVASEAETEDEYGLTPADLEDVREALTGRVGLSYEDVCTLTSGYSDPAVALGALAQQVEREEAELLELAVSAEERDRSADKGKGWALPGGAFPIADAKHLAIAKGDYAAGRHAGHPAHVVKAHINNAAKRLGLPGLDDEDGDEDEADREVARRKPRTARHYTKPVQVVRRGQYATGEGGGPEGGAGPSGGDGAAMTARRVAVRTAHGYQTLALTGDQADELGMTGGDTRSKVDRIAARNPELLELASGIGPMEFGDLPEVHDTGSSRDPSEQDTRSTEEIARLLAEAAGMFAEKPHGSVNTYQPTPYRSPDPSGKPQNLAS